MDRNRSAGGSSASPAPARPPLGRVVAAVLGTVLVLLVGTSAIMAGRPAIGGGLVAISLVGFMGIAWWLRRIVRGGR